MFLYGAIALAIVGLLVFLTQRKTLAVSLIILAIMIGAGAFGYSKVFATTFAMQNNMYIVNFSQEEYEADDAVSFTLGFFDKNTFSKNTDSSVSVSVNGGPFEEVVSALGIADTYQVTLGKMPVGTNTIKLKGITAARFNIAKFGFSKFGQDNEDIELSVVVGATHECGPAN